MTTTTTTSTTTTLMPTIIKENLLVGSNNNLVSMEYSSNGASVIHTEDLGSSVTGIVYAEKTNKAFISSLNNLYSYDVSYYVNSSEVVENLSVTNTNNTLMSTYRKSDNSLWAVQSYNGNVVKMNPTDLSITKTFSNLDAPYKIRYSAYHNAYFVAGSHILWKIDSLDVVTTVYEINGYTLKDFDVSESGIICMLFKGAGSDIIRVVNNDLYTLKLDKKISNGNVAFCKYVNAGKYYILVELNTLNTVYSVIHYVYDYVANKLSEASSEDVLSTTTTTTTLGTTSSTISVTSPNVGDKIQIGQQYDIKWLSAKSSNDSVKIELYKANILYSVLSTKTNNTGIFSWNVASNIEEDEDYNIKITWLAANNDPSNYNIGGVFGIFETVSTTTTTTTTRLAQHAIGIDYAVASNEILIVLASGLYMGFRLSNLTSYGLLSLGISNPLAIATRSMIISGSSRQTKFRIFVGSEEYLSDRWDSGIIESGLKSCYYGAGANLIPGGKYYSHLQTYSEKYGWSELEINEFVVPK